MNDRPQPHNPPQPAAALVFSRTEAPKLVPITVVDFYRRPLMLPNDYARCSGKHQPNTDGAWPFPKLADECAACRRREPVSEDAARVVMIGAPEESPCPSRIAQEGL